MINSYRNAWLVAVLVLAVTDLACQTPHKAAQSVSTLAQDLAQRQEAADKSMALYKEALDDYQADRLDKAKELLQQAVAVNDQNAYAWMALGVIEHKRDHMFEAAGAFYRAATLEPSRYEPHLDMGTIMETVGRYNQAIEEYELALKLSPDQLEVTENLARCYIRSHTKPERAKELIARARLSEQRSEWRLWLEQQHRWLEMKSDTTEHGPS